MIPIIFDMLRLEYSRYVGYNILILSLIHIEMCIRDRPSTASTPNYNREVHTMTIIKINGGFWGGEPIETLERLYPLFEQYTLDPIYE